MPVAAAQKIVPPPASSPNRNFPSDAEWRLIMQTASYVWGSGIAKQYSFDNEATVILVMLKGWELGLGLMGSLDGIRIIHGKVSPSAECMQGLAMHKVQGARFKWLADGRDGKRAEILAIRPGHDSVQVAYTMEDAERGGVASKNPTYGKWPAALLRAGAMRQACRILFADILMGFDDPDFENPGTYVPEPAPAVQTPGQLPVGQAQPAQLPEARPGFSVPVEHQPEPVTRAPAQQAPPAATASPVTSPTSAREPGDDHEEPQDLPLPFDEGRYQGKSLSDLTDVREFKLLVGGFRKKADEFKAAGDQESADGRLAWAKRVITWAKYRGFEIS